MTLREQNTIGHPGRITRQQVMEMFNSSELISSISIAQQLKKDRRIVTDRLRELEQRGEIVCVRQPGIGRFSLPGIWKKQNENQP